MTRLLGHDVVSQKEHDALASRVTQLVAEVRYLVCAALILAFGYLMMGHF